MKKPLLAVAMCVVSACSLAKDLDRSDPERKVILDDIRSSKEYSHLSENKFVVKRIWASDQWAYLCAMVLEDGSYQRTDDSIDVYQIILKRRGLALSKQGVKWIPVAQENGLAESPNKIHCRIADEQGLSDKTLENIADEYKKRWR